MAEKKTTMGTMNKIFILHGWTYSSLDNNPLDKWQPFIKLIKSHKIESTIFRIPGLTKDVNQVWNIEKYVEWLKKIVDKEKGKVVLIGHSNGGRIAFSFAQKYPEKVSKLILIDSAGIYHNELPIRLKRFVFKILAKIGKKITSSEKLKIILYKLAREGDYKNATSAQRQTMLSLIKTDFTPIISKVKIPTLIIWGDKDRITPLSDGKLIHKLIKGSKLEIIKDAHHAPQFTNPEKVAKIIHEYL